MQREPRNPDTGIFSGKTLISVTYRGILIAAVVIIAQWIGMNQSPELGVAMAFSTLIWSRTLQTLPARSNTETAWQAGLFANKMVWLAIVVCGLLYSVTLLPGIREVFAIPETFTMNHVGLSIAMAAGAVLMMEITKLIILAVQSRGTTRTHDACGSVFANQMKK